MPHARKFPRVGCAVIPLVGPGCSFVDELVADRLPRLSAVVGTLDHLAEPAGALRCVDALLVDRRSFDVINLPAGEMRSADLPFLPRPVRGEHKRPLSGTDQHSYTAHSCLLPRARAAPLYCRSGPAKIDSGGDSPLGLLMRQGIGHATKSRRRGRRAAVSAMRRYRLV